MFDDRKKQFEKKVELETENKFKVTAKRNKLLGLWAAQTMGLEKSLIDNYIETVIDSDFEKPGYSDVLEKISKDFKSKNIQITLAEIEKKLLEFEEKALNEFKK